MSELKVYHHELRHNEYEEFYLKYEADKVIEELKDKCQMHDFFWEGCGFAKLGFKNAIAVSEAYDFLEEENKQLQESITVYQRNEKISIRELHHHKYKRCLAMAELCRSEWAAAIFIHEKGGTDKQAALYMKWEKRWLALANKYKYKEAK